MGATLAVCAGWPAAWAQTSLDGALGSGPIRLRQALTYTDQQQQSLQRDPRSPGVAADAPTQPLRPQREAASAYQPGEFEQFVQTTAGIPTIQRFGAELVTRADDADSADVNPQVPPDYLIKNGDEIVVTLWGSVDADVRVVVDRTGRISIPRVGPVLVAGVRYAELPDVIRRRVGQVFRNFELSVSLGQLRGVRVYVTGFVPRPGAYSVSSLSSILNALLRAGGPSAAGSLRNITLLRGRQVVARYDLYDFLLRGDRSADALVQPDDVINVGPVGPQVGVIGSVNRPAVFELKAGETVDDVMRMAGGFTAVADRSRLAVERLRQRTDERIAEIPMPQGSRQPLSHGDVLRAFSAVSTQLSVQQQNKRVRVEGEVARPGEYVLPANSSISDALRLAGGLSPSAYVFGTEFTRESVRRTQQENYDRALRDLETEFTRATATQRTNTSDEAAAQQARATSTARLVERLRAVKPSGRVVLQVTPESTTLPELALEDGDRLYIPPRGSSVGVFGSVFNAGNYLWNGGGRNIGDYLYQAGGPTRGADAGSAFVIRANGSVVSALQEGNWFSRSGALNKVRAEPGDTIFVPEEQNKTTFIQSVKDWTQIFYQLGLGVAAIQVLKNN